MAKENNTAPKGISGKLKNRYRVTGYNDTTLEQVWHFRISGFGALVLGVVSAIALIATVIILIAFTGLREFIPGYPDENTREQIVANALRADSLEHAVHQWEAHLTNINRLLSGKDPLPIANTTSDSVRVITGSSSAYVLSREDSLLRKEIEEADRYNPTPTTEITKPQSLENLFLFPPAKGVVSDMFNAKANHLAIDIVTSPHAPVMAVLDGTVIMADWLAETGFVIQIQHDGDIISIYKHNEKLLKKQGDRVKAGEAIAIVGNSGELTTGPHLHFELWYKGIPIDPMKYIKF